jgi:capsular polysaccharide transport system permease protein
MNSLGGAIKTQRRIIWALILRETKTLFGKHKLGYLWALINASFSIGIFWTLREVGGFHPPLGLSTPVFLLSGFIPFYIYSAAVNTGLSAVNGNRALLAYPQVFPIDLLVARSLLQGAMYLCVMIILLVFAYIFDEGPRGWNPETVFFALFLALILGFGVGALSSSLSLKWPVTERIVPIMNQVLFYTSGLFFSVESLPKSVQNILYFNPIPHIIELTRVGFSWRYESRFVDLIYVNGFLLVTLMLGLLLERYSRRFIEAA